MDLGGFLGVLVSYFLGVISGFWGFKRGSGKSWIILKKNSNKFRGLIFWGGLLGFQSVFFL